MINMDLQTKVPQPLHKKEKITNHRGDDAKIKLDKQLLISKGIGTYNMTQKDYMKFLWTDGSAKVCKILTDPSTAPGGYLLKSIWIININMKAIGGKNASEVPEMLRDFLKQEAYVRLIMPHHMFNEWLNSFYNAGFEVMNHPFGITQGQSFV